MININFFIITRNYFECTKNNQNALAPHYFTQYITGEWQAILKFFRQRQQTEPTRKISLFSLATRAFYTFTKSVLTTLFSVTTTRSVNCEILFYGNFSHHPGVGRNLCPDGGITLSMCVTDNKKGADAPFL